MRQPDGTFATTGVGVEIRNPGPEIARGVLHIEAGDVMKLVYFVVGPFDVRAFLLNEHVPPGLRCSVRLEGPCLGRIIETLAGALREWPVASVGVEASGA